MSDEDFQPTSDDITPLTLDDIANHLSQQGDDMIRNGADPKTVGAAMQERMQKIQEVYSRYGPKVFGPKSNFANKPDVAGLEGIYSSPDEPGIYGQPASLSDVNLVEGSNTKNVLTDPLSSVKNWNGEITDMDGSTPDAGGFLHTAGDVAKQAVMNYTPAGLIPYVAGGFAGIGEYAGSGDLDKAKKASQDIIENLTPTPETKAGEYTAMPMQYAIEDFQKYAGEGTKFLARELGATENEAQLAADVLPMSALTIAGGKELAKGFKTKLPFAKPKEPVVESKVEPVPATGDPAIDLGMHDASSIYRHPVQEDLFDNEGANATRDMFSGELQDAAVVERDRQAAKEASIFGDEQRLPEQNEANEDLFRNQPIVPGMPLTRGYALTEQKPTIEGPTPEQSTLPLQEQTGQLDLNLPGQANDVLGRAQAPIVTRGDVAARQPVAPQAPEVPQKAPNVTLDQVSGIANVFSESGNLGFKLPSALQDLYQKGQLTVGHVIDAGVNNLDGIFDNHPEAIELAKDLQRAGQRFGGLDNLVQRFDENNPADLDATKHSLSWVKGNAQGLYNPFVRRVLMRSDTPSYLIALHEASHAVRYRALELGRLNLLKGAARQGYALLGNVFDSLKNHSLDVSKKINDFFEKTTADQRTGSPEWQDKLDKWLDDNRNAKPEREYGFKNVHEMMAEFDSNPKFREFLRTIRLDSVDQGKMGMPRLVFGKLRNMYQAIIGGSSKLLGLSEKATTAYDAIYAAKEHMFRDSISDVEAKKIGDTNFSYKRPLEVSNAEAPSGAPNSIYEAGLSPRRAVQNLRETKRGEESIPGKLGLVASKAINDAAKSEKVPGSAINDYIENGNQTALNNFPKTKAAVDDWQNNVRTPLAAQGAREKLLQGDQEGANKAMALGQGPLVSAYQGPKFARKMFKLAEAGDKLQANGGTLQPEHIQAMQTRQALNDYVKAKFYPNGFTPTPEGLKAVDQYSKELTGLRDSIFGLLRQDLSGKNANYVRNVLANGGLGRGFSIPKEVADALGKTNDAAANVLNTSLKQGLDIAKNRFQTSALKAGLEGGWMWKTKEEAPAGSVALTGSHWGPLEGTLMSPATKRQFMNVKELSVSTDDLVTSMLKSNGAMSIAKGTVVAGMDAWMGAVSGLKGWRLVTGPKNYIMFALGAPSRLLSAGFNFGPSAAIRGMRESINEFRSGVTSQDHMELQRNGLIDYASNATTQRRIKAAQFSNDLEMNPIREAMDHWYTGSGTAIHGFSAKIEGALSAMDYWAIKANYFKRKEQLQAHYDRQGIEKDPREIEREAADQTKQTNMTPSRNYAFARAIERSGASVSIPYQVELHRNIFNSVLLGGEDIKRAAKTGDIAFGLVGAKRIIGSILAVTAGDYIYKQLGQIAASALGITSTEVPDDDKRQAQLQDEGSRFAGGKASQLTDASTEADKQNAYYWDPGGAWDPFYSLSQEIARTSELVANWNTPGFDKEKQVNRILDNIKAVMFHNQVSGAAGRIVTGKAPPLARRDEDTYNAESSSLQNGGAGLSPENSNRALSLQDVFTPQAIKDYQNTKGLSTGMQILGQLGYSVTKVPRDGGLSSFEATKFNNTAETARTTVTNMLQDKIDYSDATIERRYVNALKTMNGALEKVRNAADFGRSSGVDETDMQRGMLAKDVNKKVIGTLGDVSPAEILYRNITGGVERRASLINEEGAQEEYINLAKNKMDKFVELTQKYADYTPEQIKGL